jgi:hypothetical protein
LEKGKVNIRFPDQPAFGNSGEPVSPPSGSATALLCWLYGAEIVDRLNTGADSITDGFDPAAALAAELFGRHPMGHACSNVIEQLGALPTYVRPPWATDERQTLPYMIAKQMERPTEVLCGMSGNVHTPR